MWGCPKAPHRSALPFEAHCRRVVELAGEDLRGDYAVEARLAGAVHGAVAAAADEDRVRDAVDPEIAVLGRRGVGAARVHDG